MKTLAIIPARGGSKGIPRKNMADIAGFPLIHYSITAAVNSNLFSGIIVTSDDDEILDYASNFDVYLHKRDSGLASDKSLIIDTIKEVIIVAEKDFHISFDTVMLLQPTSPLRTVDHLKDTIELLKADKKANSVISVTQIKDHHPCRMYTIEDDSLTCLQPELEHKRRQDLPDVFIRNGSIYLARKRAVLEWNDIMVKPAIPYIMDNTFYINIDEPRDLAMARYIIEKENRMQLCV